MVDRGAALRADAQAAGARLRLPPRLGTRNGVFQGRSGTFGPRSPSFPRAFCTPFVTARSRASWEPIPGAVEFAFAISLKDFADIARYSVEDTQTQVLGVAQHLRAQRAADDRIDPFPAQSPHQRKTTFVLDAQFTARRSIDPFLGDDENLRAPIQYRSYAGSKDRDGHHINAIFPVEAVRSGRLQTIKNRAISVPVGPGLSSGLAGETKLIAKGRLSSPLLRLQRMQIVSILQAVARPSRLRRMARSLYSSTAAGNLDERRNSTCRILMDVDRAGKAPWRAG